MPVLNFKGKSIIETYHHTVPHHRLEFDEKLSCLGKGEKPSLEGNLIIEGDNLLALKALLPTHAGKVKCIYIDPPYNTGNEGWVYNDNLTQPQFKEWIGQTVGKEGEDATRHDKWCCMMYPRLQLLRELLREDGSIWVSIDDNEVHTLRMLLAEVFGVENFVTTIIWQKIYSPRSSAKHFSESHDYLVCYAKSLDHFERNLLPRTEEQNERYSNPDKDPRGDWKPSDLSARNYYSKGIFAIKCPSGRVIERPPGGRYWRCSEENFKKLVKDNRIWWGPKGDNVPSLKRFLTEVKQGLVPQTIWTYDEVGHTQDAKKEILEIFDGEMVFMTPKPVALIKRVVSLASNPGDVVLDSFAGSGTTGHAVLSCNTDEDETEQPRKFILIQQAAETSAQIAERANIAKEVTAKRIRKVISGFSFSKTANGGGEAASGETAALGGTFGYVRVGEPLFGEYRDLGKKPPDYQTLAKYIFYTESSREIDLKKIDEASGFIGETPGVDATSYYLFYQPKKAEGGNEVSLDTLKKLLKDKNRNWVIYAEKVWLHDDDLRKFEKEHGKHIRTMVIPFQLQ